MANPITELRRWSNRIWLLMSQAESTRQSRPERLRAARQSKGKNRRDVSAKRLHQRGPRSIKPLYARPGFWLVLLLGAGIAGTSARAHRLWVNLEASLPDVEQSLTFERSGTITIKAGDDSILQKLGPASQEKLDYEALPDLMVQAFIASEDRRFYQHDGVDYRSIGRAIWANLRRGEVVEGASTITQQLARIVFLDQERSLERKLKEAVIARRLEQELGKQKILERYLNLVYLGAGAYGVADAAWIYFGKSVDQLTLSEIALIAGMAPAPSVYSPLVDPAAARQQRDKVISRMLANGLITQSQADTAYAASVETTPNEPKYLYSQFPYFTIYVQKQLTEFLSAEEIEAGGLTVETTLNPKWQRAAEATVAEVVEDYGDWQRFEQASLVALDPTTGEIKAMVGGTDFDDSQFNRVTQAQRQPGSTFKAFVYATAIATGMSPYKSYNDARYVVDGYEPKNYGGGYSGTVELRRALASSINIVAVKLLIDVGFEPVIAAAKRTGIESELMPTYSLALGASEVNLLELTSAYGSFAAEGKHFTPHGITRIINNQGEVLYEFKPEPVQAFDRDTAAIIDWMLRSVVEGGTGSNAYISGRQIAGKTGTSEKNRDLWFVGFTPQLVAGVWLGNDDSSPTRGASSTAARAWHNFVIQFIDDLPVQEFPELPRLSGREGTIEAQPVKPGKVVADKPGSSEERDSSERRERRRERSSESEPEPRAEQAEVEAAPEPASNSRLERLQETVPERSSTPAPAPVAAPEPEPARAPEPSRTPEPAPAIEPAAAPAPVSPPPAPSTPTAAPPPAPAPAPAPVSEPPQPQILDEY
nr:penicillin-binding protein 1A [Romeria gracilis]